MLMTFVAGAMPLSQALTTERLDKDLAGDSSWT